MASADPPTAWSSATAGGGEGRGGRDGADAGTVTRGHGTAAGVGVGAAACAAGTTTGNSRTLEAAASSRFLTSGILANKGRQTRARAPRPPYREVAWHLPRAQDNGRLR
ncbi:hypothetical protein Sar04_17580 [Salinispora arenicola]|uniref:Uncharacterized protein n=1 Tax=Salinispora arenicola TaxID=168697 RepID=A0ABQ4JT32_SALAC|nr:hypothetical protein Sar04_17580 [Salinispora arenicola]